MAVANFHDLVTLQEIQTSIGALLVKLDKLQVHNTPGAMRYEATKSHLMAAHENVTSQVDAIQNSFEDRR